MESFLSIEERERLRFMHRDLRNKKDADRIKVILCLARGYTIVETASIVLMDESTIRQWKLRYDEGNIERLLCNNHKGQVSFLSAEQIVELDTLLQARIYGSTLEISELIKSHFGQTYSTSGVRSLLARMGYEYKSDRIYFMDGAHPLHNSQPSYGWIKAGKTVFLPRIRVEITSISMDRIV